MDLAARLDGSSAWPVATWLMGLGVDVARSVSSPSPFKGRAHALPGIVEAEDYDYGGPEVAYHDTTPQNFPLGAYRVDGVDVDPTNDSGGGYNIGGIAAGEWLRYGLAMSTAGTYDLEVRAASPGDGYRLHVELDGRDVSGPVTIPNTHDWQVYQTTTVPNVRVEADARVLRIVFDTAGINLNWVRFAPHVAGCGDKMLNGKETDVDCGGGCPQKCGEGMRCGLSSDCISANCEFGLCRWRDGGVDAGPIDATTGAGGAGGASTTTGVAGTTGSTSSGSVATSSASSGSSSGSSSSTTGVGVGGSSPADKAPPPAIGCGCRTPRPSSNRSLFSIAVLGATIVLARRVSRRKNRA
jgi:hypothetical protein